MSDLEPMYKPWKPAGRIFKAHPQIDWKVEQRSVVLSWTEWLDNQCQFEMEIVFENGLAGLLCLDESTYQTACDLGAPQESELDSEGFEPLPWPAWKSEQNYRKRLYGALGELNYTDIYTYFLVGSDTVLLIDIADSEPTINIKQNND